MSHPPIGIDLGTTYSAAAVYRNGKPEMIVNDQGSRSMPSCVAFTPNRRFFGEGAVRQAALFPENSIYGIKRLIGRKFDDPEVQENIKAFPFKILNNNGEIAIEVNDKGKILCLSVEEISAMILESLKKMVELVLDMPIKDVVITCPANFDNAQRESTMAAAKIAGLNVIRMMNEPTAAALSYGWSLVNVDCETVLVFDFGGGTCDISILKIHNNDYKVLVTTGDVYLGGEDFDKRMVEYFVAEFKRKYRKDISGDKSLMRKLKILCEAAKKQLSVVKKTEFTLEDAFLVGKINRSTFEKLNMDLFERAIKLVDTALEDGGLKKENIDEVVLAGGSSKIPKMQEMIKEYFGGRMLYTKNNPDDAVAEGAAIQAALIQNMVSGTRKGTTISEVCPLSIGIRTFGDRFLTFVERNSVYPIKAVNLVQTTKPNQKVMHVEVYEGQRIIASQNRLLGALDVLDIPPGARGEQTILITFDVDENGITKVTAQVQSTGKISNLTILKKDRLGKDDADKVVSEAKNFHLEDEAHRKKFENLKLFQNFLWDMERSVNSLRSEDVKRKGKQLIESTFAWLDDWTVSSPKTAEFDKKKEVIQYFWNQHSVKKQRIN
ncbi:heat shock protein 68-like [Culicoides brevitarsis]|uniref:heat shock protein 68-like n=1 Tax=Culicoides brevitarsis TaxID=469753 RepID=UPI00307B2868